MIALERMQQRVEAAHVNFADADSYEDRSLRRIFRMGVAGLIDVSEHHVPAEVCQIPTIAGFDLREPQATTPYSR